MGRIIPRESLLVFPTTPVLYLGVQDIGGVGASFGDGIGYGLVFCLGVGEVGGSWLVWVV